MVRPAATAKPAAASPLAYLKRLSGGLFDWETLITLGLLLGAVTAVSAALEDGGWRANMPPLTTVSVAGVLTGTLLVRSRLSVFLAGPLAILTGAAVVGWQTLVMAGPGTLHERLIEVQDRFSAWFHIVSTNTVTNDPLPFNVLIISLTWLGVMLLVWSVYRWHNAWIGLIPGGVALFLDLALVGDNLTGAIAIYMLCGFLLVMQTNLLSNIAAWRRENAQYPAMINLTFLNFSFWVLLLLMLGAWALPAGLSTPAPVQAIAEDTINFGARFARLAGPLQSKTVIPIHAYSGTLPFQGSVSLGNSELMSVTSSDQRIQGSLLLRGSTYDDYETGGWQTGARVTAPSLPPSNEQGLQDQITSGQIAGELVPLHIQMQAKTVIGTVIFAPGEPVSVSHDLTVQIPASSVTSRPVLIPGGGSDVSDAEVLATQLKPNEVGIGVERDPNGNVTLVDVASIDHFGLIGDAEGLDPGGRIKRYESYDVTGFIPTYSADELRGAGTSYPDWVTNEYLQLPSDLPGRVHDLAVTVTDSAAVTTPGLGAPSTPYDEAVAIQDFLRKNYSIDYKVPDTPPGRDTVDYFLFDRLRGYFDYHASAMVVMLRSLGVPARLAVGFAVDDSDKDAAGAYSVKDQNSYAWPEVYFPNHGWVSFNPTPDRSSQIAPTLSDAPPPISGLDPRITRFLPAGADPITNVPLGDVSQDSPSGGVSLGGGTSGTDWLAIGVLAFIAALIGAIALGWQRSVAGLPYPQQVWEKTVRLASWGGAPPLPGQTPHDYARGLGKRFLGVRDFPVLADAYTKSRFGHKEIDEDQAALLKEAWPDVRGALLGSIVRRIWPRHRRDPRD
jgi:transglutaminase-like putative cysteine protease